MATGDGSITLPPGEGKSSWFLGSLITLKATGENTGGAFGLIEQVLPPGFAPPPHVHRSEDECFYILEGEITFQCGDRTFKAEAGSLVLLPRDIVHGFSVEGSKPARLLQLNSPAGLEHFFEEMGEPAKANTLPPPAGPPDMEKLLTLARKYNFEIKGPPPREPS